MYTSLHSIYRRLPPSWRTGLKRTLGSDGHGRSNLDWLTARKDATGKKRLDRALDGIINTLGSEAARQVTGKVCIDFGAGYVPTDGVALWLLGAKAVHGIDFNDIAKPREIARAVQAADLSHVRSQLQDLGTVDGWTDRLDRLTCWARAGGDGLPPGYNYVAPVDVTASPDHLPTFDLLVSTSVLEHVPPSLMVALLDTLKSRENERASQYHRVDLRDHRDFQNAPYAFLDATTPFDPETEADARGNGMTLADWELLLTDHPGWGLAVKGYEMGRPHLMPRVSDANAHIVADSLVLRTEQAGAQHSCRRI